VILEIIRELGRHVCEITCLTIVFAHAIAVIVSAIRGKKEE
jgi:hypothetical protein